MDLYPAIDLRGGQAVRLTQGDFSRQSDYGDPVILARSFLEAGISWLHVVDLDAARSGEPVNRATVLAIAEIAEAAGVPVQTGGGVRTDSDVDALLSAGLGRVVLGTSALADPAWACRQAERHPGKVALGLDTRMTADGRAEVAVRGWEQGSGRTLTEVLAEMVEAPFAAVVVTAIERDGTLAGPDLDGLAAVLAQTELPVVASGGVGSVADVAALAALTVGAPGGSGERRLAGAIVGKALVDGRVMLAEALDACRAGGVAAPGAAAPGKERSVTAAIGDPEASAGALSGTTASGTADFGDTVPGTLVPGGRG